MPGDLVSNATYPLLFLLTPPRTFGAGRPNTAADLRIAAQRVLQGDPAQMLLYRLDSATIVIGLDGVVVYANPACERRLGYQTARTLEGQFLSELLIDQPGTPPRYCIEPLRDPDTVTNWNHSDGYPIAALASDPDVLPRTPTA